MRFESVVFFFCFFQYIKYIIELLYKIKIYAFEIVCRLFILFRIFEMSNFANIGRRLATNVFKTLNQSKASVTLLQPPVALSSQKRYFKACLPNCKKKSHFKISLQFINRLKSYYGEPSEYKTNEENVVLVSDENLKWKQIPANS